MAMFLERLRQDGKVAIVTGGAQGVGWGIANVLANAGASVVLMGRTQDSLDNAVVEIKKNGGSALAVAGNVVKKADCERVIEAALREFGRIDILINTVGGTRGQTPFLELDQEEFQQDFLLNVQTVLQMTQLAAPHLMERGEGSVVNISSRAAQFARHGSTSYSVAKAALERLTLMMAKELAPKIRVNAISLGAVATDAFERAMKASPLIAEQINTQIPLQRPADPEDIGLAALYFCSEKAYATGSILRLDGGIEKPLGE